jgi:ribosomal protein L37AE/L43A
MRRIRSTSTAEFEPPEAMESLGNRRAAADRELSGDIHTRTCAKCGRRAFFRIEEGGWARCSACGRYA